MINRQPDIKLTIVGGGIIGALEAYFAYLNAKLHGQSIRVTVHEKNKNVYETTTGHIVPSLTPDEILSVVPRGLQLIEKLKLLFSEKGGIKVEDVAGVNGTNVAKQFIDAVQLYSQDEFAHERRTKALLELGKLSMQLWQDIYDNADEELKQILQTANFNPCREPRNEKEVLHDGYRIDLIYNYNNAAKHAMEMQKSYEELGYQHCKILSPKEVMERDPYLTDFCYKNSVLNNNGELQWKEDAVALWRPGGCIDTQVFLPKFYDYLKKLMGNYENSEGKTKNCFQIHYDHEIASVKYDEKNANVIDGLNFSDGKTRINHHKYQEIDYVFCPGEAVGTLNNLGFAEPPYAGFAGASLMINIPLTADMLSRYQNYNHCMEIHQDGVILALQGRIKDNKLFIGVAGTKAFYSDKRPDKDEAFAKDRNLLQLNIINDVLPDLISQALGRDTKGQKLTEEDLFDLEKKGIAIRWAGRRAVAYDGFPTLGELYHEGNKIVNARTTTHLGSGGASFSPAAVLISQSLFKKQAKIHLYEEVLQYGASNRRLN